MRQSFCGLCDDCQLGHPDFMETVARLKGYVEGLRVNWWSHCFPRQEGFDFSEFRKGLEWFLSHTQCPGCHGGRGLDECPIRRCAISRGLDHCSQCPDLEPCDKFIFLLLEFPDAKTNLLRRRLKRKARDFHRKLEAGK
jgi:hypothetical protein